MAVGAGIRGPLWVDGQFTVRVRGPGADPGRIVRVRRPFALIGQIPGADVRIDDLDVDGRHALLLLDRRGVFGVDLLSKTGTRFSGSSCGWAWLGEGDVVEVAGRRVELLQLQVNGGPVAPPLPADDLLAIADPSTLVGLGLEPLDSPGPPWMLGSALAFVGRGDACAIRIENASASRTHCALLRGPSTAFVIDLLGRRTLLDGRPVEGASALRDGDILTVGHARFAVRVEPPSPPSDPALNESILSGSTELALGPREAPPAPIREDVIDALRRFQADTATLLEAQIDRIEALHREIAALRSEFRGDRGPTTGPMPMLRLDPTPPPTTGPDDSAAWLLDRLNALEAEGRSTWKDLLGRIASAVAPTRPGPPPDEHS